MPPRGAAQPRPAQEQRDMDGGKRSRRKRRRRGGRNRDGSAQEPSSRERGGSPAASIGSVVEVNGNVAPKPEAEPADWEEAREAVVAPADGGPSHETLVTTATGATTHEAGDAPPSSRRRRRRRKRSRGEGASDTGEAPPVSRQVPAVSPGVRQDEAWEAFAEPVAPPPETEQPAPAPAPVPVEARVPEARGETDRGPAPPEEPLAKKAPKKTALEQGRDCRRKSRRRPPRKKPRSGKERRERRLRRAGSEW